MGGLLLPSACLHACLSLVLILQEGDAGRTELSRRGDAAEPCSRQKKALAAGTPLAAGRSPRPRRCAARGRLRESMKSCLHLPSY